MIYTSKLTTSVIKQDCYRSAIAALYISGGKLHYTPQEWVPDEYETLAQAGLVNCEFGRPDAFNSELMSRDITLTKAGVIAAKSINDAIIPSCVTFSFHSALSREQKGNARNKKNMRI